MILALKTAGTEAEISLINTGTTVASARWEAGRRLSDELHGRILELLASSNLTLSDIAGIIIFSGPGSFTSLRIGHATANALADGLKIPVVGCSGEDWQKQGSRLLPTAKPAQPALPHYGSEAHITRPKA